MSSETASLTRRSFAACIGGAAFAAAPQAPRPNILWLTAEDIGPQLGTYGDRYASTPHLDRFATTGQRFDCCWSNAPVCAPARTALISGLYPTSAGTEHHRSLVSLPPGLLLFPQYLRQAGYYCTNNAKEDYNLRKPGEVWDESGFGAHYRKRGAGQPFFSVFNFGITHESQVQTQRPNPTHDPATAPLPAYYPDTPGVRRDLAQYYDNISTMDGQFGAALRQLEQAGLAEDTIVFFYGDNGRCLPRGKRIAYNSGLNVPFLLHVPEKFRQLGPAGYQPGSGSDRPVSFVDFAPTVLSLAGSGIPGHLQGRAFMGQQAAPEAQYVHGFRGRMDERYDLMRATRDRRYVYVRNYNPHRIYGEHVIYAWLQSTMRDWDALSRQGRLTPAQSRFWHTKPYEELFDLHTDPEELNNLAGEPAQQATLKRLRQAQDDWMREVKDVGLLPEPEVHARCAGSTPYQLGHDAQRYDYAKVKGAADTAASGRMDDIPRLRRDLNSPDSGVRYWAANGLLIRKEKGVAAAAPELAKALDDPSPSVRIAAAEALGRYGGKDDQQHALRVLVELGSVGKAGIYVAGLAWNSIDQLPGELLRQARPQLEAIDVGPEPASARVGAVTNRPAVDRRASFDLFGAGNDTEESRAGMTARTLKSTLLERLG